MIGVREDVAIAPATTTPGADGLFHTPALRRAVDRLPDALRHRMVWWRLPEPGVSNLGLESVVEAAPADVRWHSTAETGRLLTLMSPKNLAKVEAAQRSGERRVGALYRRTRRDTAGSAVQRAEVRFDIAGCLRTPGGGSSRQTLLVVEAGPVPSDVGAGNGPAHGPARQLSAPRVLQRRLSSYGRRSGRAGGAVSGALAD